MASAIMRVKDKQTKQTFSFDVTLNTVQVKTKDGVRVTLHPVALRLMVKKGSRFDGHTLTGTREMVML